MPPAFSYYQPQSTYNAQADANAQKNLTGAQQNLNRVNGQYQQASNDAISGRATGNPNDIIQQQRNATNAYSQAQGAANSAARDPVTEARDQAFGMTAGVSDRIMNDANVSAALGTLRAGSQSGPYTPEIQQQLISRQADQTAKAEGVNNEQLANDMAARGISPSDPAYQAQLRQGQAQRQQSNIAFAGDVGTNAALQNYTAQQAAAGNLGRMSLAQYGQAQPGYAQAANYNWNTAYNGGRTPAVTGGGMGGTPFPQRNGNSALANFDPGKYVVNNQPTNTAAANPQVGALGSSAFSSNDIWGTPRGNAQIGPVMSNGQFNSPGQNGIPGLNPGGQNLFTGQYSWSTPDGRSGNNIPYNGGNDSGYSSEDLPFQINQNNQNRYNPYGPQAVDPGAY